jgi:sugar phosphate isomerase/epimerase
MKLSLSVRVAEEFRDKRQVNMSLEELAKLAAANGYHALCMRASQLGTHTSLDVVREKSGQFGAQGLEVSMVTGDFPIPENSEEGPQALRNITPYLDLAAALGADLLRIAMKKEEDIEWAQRAADEAAERNMRLAHQCHTLSLFEEVDKSLDVLQRVGRDNFGIIYEPANLDLCGQDYGPETIKRLVPHTFNVYLQNHLLKDDGDSMCNTWVRGEVRFDQIPMWSGQGLDFATIMATLEEIGYDGYVTIHQASAQLGTQAAVEESGRYLRSLATFEGSKKSS